MTEQNDLYTALENHNPDFELENDPTGVRIVNYGEVPLDEKVDFISFLQNNRDLHQGFSAGIVRSWGIALFNKQA